MSAATIIAPVADYALVREVLVVGRKLVATRLETASDARLKDIQGDLPPVLDKLHDLDLKLYEWKESGDLDKWQKRDNRDAGVIAQNVEALFGELIPGIVVEGEDGFKHVKQNALMAIPLMAIKELAARQDVTVEKLREFAVAVGGLEDADAAAALDRAALEATIDAAVQRQVRHGQELRDQGARIARLEHAAAASGACPDAMTSVVRENHALATRALDEVTDLSAAVLHVAQAQEGTNAGVEAQLGNLSAEVVGLAKKLETKVDKIAFEEERRRVDRAAAEERARVDRELRKKANKDEFEAFKAQHAVLKQEQESVLELILSI